VIIKIRMKSGSAYILHLCFAHVWNMLMKHLNYCLCMECANKCWTMNATFLVQCSFSFSARWSFVFPQLIMPESTNLTFNFLGCYITMQWLLISLAVIWKEKQTVFDSMICMPKKLSACHYQTHSMVMGFKVWPKLSKMTIEVKKSMWQLHSLRVHSGTITASLQKKNYFIQCQSETLCKKQDFINNPFKVKCLPLQF